MSAEYSKCTWCPLNRVATYVAHHESLLTQSSFKVDYFILPIIVVPKLRSVAQNEWKKTPIYIFSTFGSKINKFERKKLEKNKKIPKT